jgi:hypothetical protein
LSVKKESGKRRGKYIRKTTCKLRGKRMEAGSKGWGRMNIDKETGGKEMRCYRDAFEYYMPYL